MLSWESCFVRLISLLKTSVEKRPPTGLLCRDNPMDIPKQGFNEIKNIKRSSKEKYLIGTIYRKRSARNPLQDFYERIRCKKYSRDERPAWGPFYKHDLLEVFCGPIWKNTFHRCLPGIIHVLNGKLRWRNYSLDERSAGGLFLQTG